MADYAEDIQSLRWVDKDHVYINGRQFISLQRFLSAQVEKLEEYNESLKLAEATEKENIHLKALLFKELSAEVAQPEEQIKREKDIRKYRNILTNAGYGEQLD